MINLLGKTLALTFGGLAIMLVWMLTRAWQGMPPLLRSWLWRFVFIKFVVAFSCPIAFELAWLPRDAASSIAGPAHADDLPASLITRTGDKLGPDSRIADVDSLAPWSTITAWFMLLWLAGVGICFIRLQRSWWTTRRFRQAGTPVETTNLLDTVARLSARMGMARPPSVRMVSDVPGPLVLGVFRPVVILPTTLLERGDRAELELVLAHELAHCRRWDLAWDWLPTLVRALFFFHPLVSLASRETRLASEIACDELVIQDTDKPAGAYADVLLRIALEVSLHGCRRPLGAIGVFESYKSLKRRLKALSNRCTMSPRQLRLALIPAFALAVAMIVPWRLTSQTIAGLAGSRLASGDVAQSDSEKDESKGELTASELNREYETKKAAAKAALADSVAADKARDEARERWITANRLFSQRALSEEELRMAKLKLRVAKLYWDFKTYDAIRKRQAANKAQVEANMAKTRLASGQSVDQTVKEANGTQAEKQQDAGPPPGKPNQQLKDALDKDISIDFDTGSLKLALDYMAERYEFRFRIDEQAFNNRGIKNIGEAKVIARNATGRLANVLQKLLDQAQATYRVNRAGDSLIIVPK